MVRVTFLAFSGSGWEYMARIYSRIWVGARVRARVAVRVRVRVGVRVKVRVRVRDIYQMTFLAFSMSGWLYMARMYSCIITSCTELRHALCTRRACHGGARTEAHGRAR